MNLKQKESGRSMVEMLGVLAVIGVLSVTGVAGFKTAIDKHRANDTLQSVMRRAVVVSSQKMLGTNVSLNEFSESDGLYSISLLEETKDIESPVFKLAVHGVSKSVCNQIHNVGSKYAIITPNTCDGVDMVFTFSNALSEIDSITDDGEVACYADCPNSSKCMIEED